MNEVHNFYQVVSEDEYQHILANKARSNWIEEKFFIVIETHRCKLATKSFSFAIDGVNVPKTSEYMMVRYAGDKLTPSTVPGIK